MADPLTFVAIGVIGALPAFFANWLFLSKFAALLDFDYMADPEEMNEKILEIVLGMIGPFILIFIFLIVASTILKVATIRSTIKIYVGKQPALTQDLTHGLRLLPRLCCLQLAYICAAMVVGFVFGLVIGILSFLLTAVIGEDATFAIVILSQMCFQVAVMYFTYTLILWDTALVVEGLPDLRPFTRSYELVKGQCCFVFCAVFLEGLAIIALFLVNYGLFGSIGTSAVAIGQSVTGVVVMPYAGIFLTVIYVNSRIKQEEECNSTVLAHDMMLDSEGPGSYDVLQPGASEIQMDAGLYTDKLNQFEDPKQAIV